MVLHFTYGVADLSWVDKRTGIYDVRNAYSTLHDVKNAVGTLSF